MADLYNRSIMMPYAALGIMPVPVETVAINFFVNRTPVYSRFPHVAVGSLSFKIRNDNYRPNSTTINEGTTYSSSDVTLTVTDASIFLPGDVIEIESEQLLITAISGEDLTVTRAYAGTTAATHADATTVYLVGNTRTGGEVDQDALSRVPVTTTQDLQTIQHPVQVAGSLESASNYSLPMGVASLMGYERMKAMQEVADDYERSAYYGRGVTIASATTKPYMKGLRTLITTHNTTSPTNASAYKPSDLIRDTIQPCFTSGGNPDMLLVSADFMTGLEIWGMAVQRLKAGENIFGTPIDVFEAPFLTGIAIVPAPHLRTGTAICLTTQEVRNRTKRPMFDKPRGSRGDAVESDVIMEAAIELDNEYHHAFVSGITGFAAS